MPANTIYKITENLESDKLNKNFENTQEDILEIKSQYKHLTDLYANQLSNIQIINNYRATMYANMQALESANNEFEEDDITMMFIDVNTADAVTHSNTVASYANIRLEESYSFNRYPTTINYLGFKVPLYNSIIAKRDGTEITDNEDPLYYAIADDNLRVFIENSAAVKEYIIESILSTPLLNTVVVEPVFPGMQDIVLSHGYGSTWEQIDEYNNMFPMEVIFKQTMPNATGIKISASPVSVGGSNYIGFYRIGAYHKIFKNTGTVTLEKSIAAGSELRKIELKYKFNDYTSASPIIFSKLFRIKIYDGVSVVYDSNTYEYPYKTSSQPIVISTGNLKVEIEMNKYNDISPVVEYILLGIDT
jgi:hypothetical protein